VARIDRHCGIDHQHGGIECNEADRSEIRDRIVADTAGTQMRIDGRDAGGGEIERVAIGLGFCDELGAERAIGAGAIFDHYGLAQRAA
jgi:hypothetical protein